MKLDEIAAIVRQVTYPGWTFTVVAEGTHLFLRVEFPEPDLVTGALETQRGRKWVLSPHMTRSEIVATAFKAVITALEHEARERFRYRGRMVYGPHFDVDALHAIAHRIDVRPPLAEARPEGA